MISAPADGLLLGHVAPDAPSASNERVTIRASYHHRQRILRNRFVTIIDALSPQTVFLARIVGGPFFPSPDARGGEVLAEVEVQGELKDDRPHDTNNRPATGSAVHELLADDVCAMVGLAGDMTLGCLTGREDLVVRLQSNSKDVLPRNVGIFGTVGSGKSNSVQVLIEEASAAGWAVVLLDLEAEYVEMDQPASRPGLDEQLLRFGRYPRGIDDFHVYHPVSCTSDRAGSQPFTLRMADFDASITAELLQATQGERNALVDCIDHFQQKFHTQIRTSEVERQNELLDASPQAKLPYTVQLLRSRAAERSPRNTESLDYVGLASKLQLLLHSGSFDQPNLKGLGPAEMLKPGRVNVIDVSVANDTVKNLVPKQASFYHLAG